MELFDDVRLMSTLAGAMKLTNCSKCETEHGFSRLLACWLVLVICGCSTQGGQTAPLANNSQSGSEFGLASATYPQVAAEQSPISVGPDGSTPYEDRWKLLWADALLYAYSLNQEGLGIFSETAFTVAFTQFESEETRGMLLETALGISCLPFADRKRNGRRAAEAVAEASMHDESLVKQFAKYCQDPEMLLWAAWRLVYDRKQLALQVADRAMQY